MTYAVIIGTAVFLLLIFAAQTLLLDAEMEEIMSQPADGLVNQTIDSYSYCGLFYLDMVLKLPYLKRNRVISSIEDQSCLDDLIVFGEGLLPNEQETILRFVRIALDVGVYNLNPYIAETIKRNYEVHDFWVARTADAT
jgi:hypothetical protein